MSREQRILLDNGRTVIRYAMAPVKTNRTLAVTWTGFNENDPSKPGCAEGLLVKNGFDTVLVQKRSESWFQDLTIENFRQALAGILHNYDHIVCHGFSMGAYAALYYGGSIGAAILSVSPRCSIHPRLPEAGLAELRKLVTYCHHDMRDVPKSSAPCVIAYDPENIIDRAYVSREIAPAFPDAHYLLLRHTSHPSTQALHEMGQNRDLVLGFFQTLTVPSARSILYGRRDQSSIYLRTMALRCARRGHLKWALSLYDRAIVLSANPSGIIAERDKLAEVIRKRPSMTENAQPPQKAQDDQPKVMFPGEWEPDDITPPSESGAQS